MMYDKRRSKITHYYPCIKYQIPADLEMDGTDTFIMTESMKMNWIYGDNESRDPHRRSRLS